MAICRHGKIDEQCGNCVARELWPSSEHPPPRTASTERASVHGTATIPGPTSLGAYGTTDAADLEIDLVAAYLGGAPSEPPPPIPSPSVAERRHGTAGSIDHALGSNLGVEADAPSPTTNALLHYGAFTQDIRNSNPPPQALASTDGFIPFLIVFSLSLAAFLGLVARRARPLRASPAGAADRYPTAADGYRFAELEGCRGVALRGDIGAVEPLMLASFLRMACTSDEDYLTLLDALRKGRTPDRVLVIRSDIVLFACNASIRAGWYPGQHVAEVADGVTSTITVGPARMSYIAQSGVRRGWKGRVTAEALRLIG